ncbi:hypothetical protein GCM10009712_10970 [Pseudarthrobacter sulfonivorans]|uniref:hypothetical protein n=1 Tax=Pseudarthrobacter sulfonivorans TaxID=121292 RepID=UPI00168B50AC|nr:hypothetical protein [Pseudarthrobacter sulfonivorans]
MTSQDPLEFLRQTHQRRSKQLLELVAERSDQQLELAAEVLDSFNAMHEAEQVLYHARRRYIESFKRATGGQWKAQELRDAGFPTPKVSVLKRRMDYRYLMTPPADPAPHGANMETPTN